MKAIRWLISILIFLVSCTSFPEPVQVALGDLERRLGRQAQTPDGQQYYFDPASFEVTRQAEVPEDNPFLIGKGWCVEISFEISYPEQGNQAAYISIYRVRDLGNGWVPGHLFSDFEQPLFSGLASTMWDFCLHR